MATWHLRLPGVLNPLSQYGHLCRNKAVCVRICWLMFSLRATIDLPQISQSYLPVTVLWMWRICVARCCFRVNFNGQKSHWNGLQSRKKKENWLNYFFLSKTMKDIHICVYRRLKICQMEWNWNINSWIRKVSFLI